MKKEDFEVKKTTDEYNDKSNDSENNMQQAQTRKQQQRCDRGVTKKRKDQKETKIVKDINNMPGKLREKKVLKYDGAGR